MNQACGLAWAAHRGLRSRCPLSAPSWRAQWASLSALRAAALRFAGFEDDISKIEEFCLAAGLTDPFQPESPVSPRSPPRPLPLGPGPFCPPPRPPALPSCRRFCPHPTSTDGTAGTVLCRPKGAGIAPDRCGVPPRCLSVLTRNTPNTPKPWRRTRPSSRSVGLHVRDGREGDCSERDSVHASTPPGPQSGSLTAQTETRSCLSGITRSAKAAR